MKDSFKIAMKVPTNGWRVGMQDILISTFLDVRDRWETLLAILVLYRKYLHAEGAHIRAEWH